MDFENQIFAIFPKCLQVAMKFIKVMLGVPVDIFERIEYSPKLFSLYFSFVKRGHESTYKMVR